MTVLTFENHMITFACPSLYNIVQSIKDNYGDVEIVSTSSNDRGFYLIKWRFLNKERFEQYIKAINQ